MKNAWAPNILEPFLNTFLSRQENQKNVKHCNSNQYSTSANQIYHKNSNIMPNYDHTCMSFLK